LPTTVNLHFTILKNRLMSKKELIKFGHNLLLKGRTPTEIYNAIALKTSSKEELNYVLERVFADDKPILKRNPENIKILLRANRVKLNLEYSIKELFKIAIVILIVAVITYLFSNEDVNQNEIFGWTTLIQGVAVLLMFMFVKFKDWKHLLLPTVIIYFSLWLIELLVWGIPNDLLNAYNYTDTPPSNINTPSSFKIKVNIGAARMIGFIFPYIYLIIKLFLGLLICISFWNYKKYEALAPDVKNDLKYF